MKIYMILMTEYSALDVYSYFVMKYWNGGGRSSVKWSEEEVVLYLQKG